MDFKEAIGLEKTGANFIEAIDIIRTGGSVYRDSWVDKEAFVTLKGNILSLKLKDGFHSWTISTDDLEAMDWVRKEEA